MKFQGFPLSPMLYSGTGDFMWWGNHGLCFADMVPIDHACWTYRLSSDGNTTQGFGRTQVSCRGRCNTFHTHPHVFPAHNNSDLISAGASQKTSISACKTCSDHRGRWTGSIRHPFSIAVVLVWNHLPVLWKHECFTVRFSGNPCAREADEAVDHPALIFVNFTVHTNIAISSRQSSVCWPCAIPSAAPPVRQPSLLELERCDPNLLATLNRIQLTLLGDKVVLLLMFISLIS